MTEKPQVTKLPVAKRLRMPAMRRGLVDFADERVLVTQKFLESLAPSAQGTPIVIQHPSIPIVQENIDEGLIPIHGRVSEIVHDVESDDWFIDFMIETKEGLEAMEDMQGISSGWYGQAYTGGGKHNNVPYDREAVKGIYEHFAIVPDPRYEMATDPIYLNSLQSGDCTDTIKPTTQKGNFTMKLFKKIFSTEEIKCNSLDEMYVNTEDGEISVASLLEAKKDLTAQVEAEAKENAADDESKDDSKVMANMDDEIEVDGEKIVIKSLVDEVKELRAKLEPKENEGDESKDDEAQENSDDVQAEGELGEEKPMENEGDCEPKENEGDEHENSSDDDEEKPMENSTANDKQKNFDENNRHVNNAHTNSKDDEPRYMTMNQKMNLGLELYGSSK